MTDARLRELERVWRASGAAADGAAWLLERLRAGELRPEHLDLAAYLGDPAAVEAVGPEALAHLLGRGPRQFQPVEDALTRELTAARRAAVGEAAHEAEQRDFDWLLGLGTFGHEVSVRGALAAAAHVRSAWTPDAGPESWRREAQLAYDAVRAWVEEPTAERRARVDDAHAPARRLVNTAQDPEPRRFFAGPCYQAAEAVREADPDGHPFCVMDAVDGAARVLADARGRDHRGAVGAERAEVVDALRQALVPWVLEGARPGRPAPS